MSVWITRSAPDNLRTARVLHGLGQKPLMVPVMTTVALSQPPITVMPDAIVFSSIHALRHFEHHEALLAVPVFVASTPIADSALATGYTTVTSIGNEDMLAALIRHALPPCSSILLLCGDRTSPAFADGLRGRGYRVERQVVYQPVPVENEALAHVTGALDRITAIVVHSRGGAERIVPMLRDARWHGSLWCISEQATRACGDLDRIAVHTAAHPSEAALCDMIAQLAPQIIPRRPRVSRANTDAMMGALRSRALHPGILARNDNAPRGSDDRDPPAA